MTIDQLIRMADGYYPDGMILLHWDVRRYAPVRQSKGDGLAHFLVRELNDTFDPETSDSEQLNAAMWQVSKAAAELEALIRGLSEELASREASPTLTR